MSKSANEPVQRMAAGGRRWQSHPPATAAGREQWRNLPPELEAEEEYEKNGNRTIFFNPGTADAVGAVRHMV